MFPARFLSGTLPVQIVQLWTAQQANLLRTVTQTTPAPTCVTIISGLILIKIQSDNSFSIYLRPRLMAKLTAWFCGEYFCSRAAVSAGINSQIPQGLSAVVSIPSAHPALCLFHQAQSPLTPCLTPRKCKWIPPVSCPFITSNSTITTEGLGLNRCLVFHISGINLRVSDRHAIHVLFFFFFF